MEGGIHYPYLRVHSRQALPHGLPVSYNAWTNSSLLDRSACSHKFQVGEKTHSTVRHLDAESDAPMRSVLNCGHGEGAGISHPENFSPPSTWLGFEGLRAAPDEDKALVDANSSHYSQQKCASMMVPSDQSHRSMSVSTTPNISITSAISSSVVQRASRNRSHLSKITRVKHAKDSSRSSGQPAGMHEVLKRRYICPTCGKRYAQPGGVMRHHREKHNPNSCTYCGARWSRPYQYRDHLEKYHRDADPDLVLGKTAGSRCRAKVTGRGRPQNLSPHIVKHDRQSQAAPQCLPLMPPVPAVVKAPQFPLEFSSAEEVAQPVNDVVDHSSGLPQALAGGFTTANCPSRPVTVHIPLPSPPVGGYCSDLVSADPLFELSGFIHSYHAMMSLARHVCP